MFYIEVKKFFKARIMAICNQMIYLDMSYDIKLLLENSVSTLMLTVCSLSCFKFLLFVRILILFYKGASFKNFNFVNMRIYKLADTNDSK